MECFWEAHLSPKRPHTGKKVSLKIPVELYANLSQLIEGTGFRSVTEFAVYALRDVVASGRHPNESSGYSRKEIQSLYERLRALGYLE
jgi:hypothetical protein